MGDDDAVRGDVDAERGRLASLAATARGAWIPRARGRADRSDPVASVEEAEPVPAADDDRAPRWRKRRAVRAAVGTLADQIIMTAARVPVRDRAALQAHFPGLDPEEIADKLVTAAAHGTSVVGAGVGAAAMLPVPPAMPAELATEITGVAAIECKLIAELHELYGMPAPGTARQRTAAYLGAWAHERGVDVTRPAGLTAALGGPLRDELRRQVTKRIFRNLPNLAPFLMGAAAGALLNRRETRRLAERVRADLRQRQKREGRAPEATASPSDQPGER